MKIGILGAGNIGSAIIKGFINSKQVAAQDILVKGGHHNTAQHLQRAFDFVLVEQTESLSEANLIIAALPAPITLDVVTHLPNDIITKKIPIVSVAAGINLPELQAVLPANYPLAHGIPNTPVQINQGVLGITYSDQLNSTNKALIKNTLELLGDLYEVTEDQLTVVSAVAGCGPAFVDVMIEALGDATVLYGLNRQTAYRVVEKMVQGSAELALATKNILLH